MKDVGLKLIVVVLGVFLVLGIAGCPVEREKVGVPGPPEKNTIDYDSLSQLEPQVFDAEGEFEIYDPACVSVLNSGDVEDKIDVVFLAEQYEDLGKFEDDVYRYIDFNSEEEGIFGVEPFKSNIGKFNFYFVNQTADLSCELGCFGLDRLVCCDDNEVKRFASQCPADQILVLMDTKNFCGASKDYATVCTIDDNRAELVLVHEMGHTFGGLGDEYDYGSEGIADVPNCDNSPQCEKWIGVPETGCYEGCGYTNLYRPTDKDSLMNVYIPKFGPVSNQELLSVFDNYEIGEVKEELVAAAPLERSYVVSLSYNFGEVKLEDVFVTDATFEDEEEGEFVGKILSFDEEELIEFKIDLPKTWYTFYDPSGEEKEHSSVEPTVFFYTFNAPYFKYGALLEIYNDEEEKVDEINLAPFAETCGDNVCQEQENYLECSKDCPLDEKDNICLPYEDDVCDFDCVKIGQGSDPDCRKNVLYNLMALIGVLIIVFGVLLSKHFKELSAKI
ncbi:M64 family metallopeptidase [Nanoarchaeota archaeon]